MIEDLTEERDEAIRVRDYVCRIAMDMSLLIDGLPCYESRKAPTYECRHDSLCPACHARSELTRQREGGGM